VEILTTSATFKMESEKALPSMSAVGSGRGGWFPLVHEPKAGAWQKNEEMRVDTALSNIAVFRCISLISSDVAKLPLGMIAGGGDIWKKAKIEPFSTVLRRPNQFQTQKQFFLNWMESKLTHGNAYVLLGREGRQVTSMHVLDPLRTKPLVGPDGSVYYQLATDNLIPGAADSLIVPSSEIIHDRWNTLFHPLVGLSPLFACSIAAMNGDNIQQHSTAFFKNSANPSGIISSPNMITDDQIQKIKAVWNTNYSGPNAGRVAVLGDNLAFTAMAVKPVDAQMIEQLKWSAEAVCIAFGVPPYKVGLSSAPAYGKIQEGQLQYYGDTLQRHFEEIEACLDIAFDLNDQQGVEFDLDGLLRTDTATLADITTKLTGSGILKINEGRAKFNHDKIKGGDAAYLQQQNYSLEALSKRDSLDDPFGKAPAAPLTIPVAANDDGAAKLAALSEAISKGFARR
jgi:HK97 family phage portal protein